MSSNLEISNSLNNFTFKLFQHTSAGKSIIIIFCINFVLKKIIIYYYFSK